MTAAADDLGLTPLPDLQDAVSRAQGFLKSEGGDLILDETTLSPNPLQGLWIMSFLDPHGADLQGGGLAVDADRVWYVPSNPDAEEYIGAVFQDLDDEEENGPAEPVSASAVLVRGQYPSPAEMMQVFAQALAAAQAGQQPMMPPAQQPIQVDVHLPENMVQVQVQPVPTPDIYVTVEPSIVHVEPMPAPVVNVAPAQVNVPPAQVEVSVPPAEVTVNVPEQPAPEVNLSIEPTPVTVNVEVPEQKPVRREVIRDERDRIVAVEETPEEGTSGQA